MVERTYINALLSAAAYVDFGSASGDIPASTLSDFLDRGVSATQFNELRTGFELVGQVSTSTGLSATVFREVGSQNLTVAFRGTEFGGDSGMPAFDISDFFQDILVAMGLSVVAGEIGIGQSGDIDRFLADIGLLDSDGNPQASYFHSIDFVGHSLGGHLAMVASYKYPDLVHETYTYNGAGIRDFQGPLYSSLDALWLEFVEPFVSGRTLDPSRVHNIYGDAGPQITTNDAIFEHPGSTQPVFIENFGSIETHFLRYLIDSLSVYRIFAKIDPTLDTLSGVEDMTRLFQAYTREPTGVLEEIYNDLVEYFGLVGVVEDAEGLYQSIADSDVESVLALVGGNAFEVAMQDNDSGRGYRYALQKLIPYAFTSSIAGTEAESDEYDLGSFSEQYLRDRALLLQAIVQRNTDDSIHPNKMDGQAIRFLDASAGEVFAGANSSGQGGTNTVDPTTVSNINFGSDNPEFVVGYKGDDSLYGMGGGDLLVGGKGNDYLEGGEGSDVYVFDSNVGPVGFDVVRDAYGDNRLLINGQFLSTLNQVSTGSAVYELKSADGSVIASFVPDGIDSLLIQIEGTGENTVRIEGFGSELSENQFGLTFEKADAIVPTLPPPANSIEVSQIEFPESTGVYEVQLRNAQNGEVAVGNLNDRWNYDSRTLTLNNSSLLIDARDWAQYYDVPNLEVAGSIYAFAITGGDRADVLTGGPLKDLLKGYAGSDIIYGGDSAGSYDYISGGAGSDFLYGGDGPDAIWGTSNTFVNLDQTPNPDHSDPRVRENVGDSDYIVGNAGQDALSGGNYDDTVYGGADNDLVMGGAGNDLLHGDDGDDHVYGDSRMQARFDFDSQPGVYLTYTDKVYLESTSENYSYNDILEGGGGNDRLYGETGDDILLGGLGDDWLIGDSLTVTEGGESVPYNPHGSDLLYGGPGSDSMWGSGGDDRLFGGAGDDLLSGDDPELAIHLHGHDYIRGEGGHDQIWGHGGNDRLFGDGGNDTLLGDSNLIDPQYHGADELYGGDGNDILDGGGGIDTVYGGAGADELHGDSSGIADQYHAGDHLEGGAGNDKLYGRGGDDKLVGGLGDDHLYGGAGDDLYVYSLGSGVDTLYDAQGSNTLKVEFSSTEVDFFQQNATSSAMILRDGSYIQFSPGTIATVFVDFIGSADLQATDIDRVVQLSQDLTAVETGAGDDWVQGSSLNDTVAAGSGDDVVFGDTGDPDGQGDYIDGQSGDDELWGEAGNDALLGNDGNDILYGNEGSDWLLGGEGNDYLDGGEGGNLLVGSLGDDVYRVWLDGEVEFVINTDTGDGFDQLTIMGGANPAHTSFLRSEDHLLINTGQKVVWVVDQFKDYGRVENRQHALDKLLFDGSTVVYDKEDVARLAGLPTAAGEQLTMSGGIESVIPFSDLLVNDAASDHGVLTIKSVGNAQSGIVQLDVAKGAVNFMPDAGYFGPASFDYTVTDGIYDLEVTASLDLVNQSPIGEGDHLSIKGNRSSEISFTSLLDNDTDPDHHPLTITAAFGAVNGEVEFFAEAESVVFTPDPDYIGDAAFEYTLSDGYADLVVEVHLTVEEPNVAPVAYSDDIFVALNHDHRISLSELLQNDYDANGDTLVVESVSGSIHGSAIIDWAAREIVFSPESNYIGQASFSYVISDGFATSEATVGLDVLPWEVLQGTAGNDDIDGGSPYKNMKVVYGLDGDDYIHSFGTDNILYGGNGDDVIEVSRSGNIIFGGRGNDELTGSSFEVTTIHGGAGDDTIHGARVVSGGPGNDELFGQAGLSNSYFYYRGDGRDYIYQEEDVATRYGENTITFGPGIDKPSGYTFSGTSSQADGIDIAFNGNTIVEYQFLFEDGSIIEPHSLDAFVLLDSAEYRRFYSGTGSDTLIADVAQYNTLNGGLGDDYLVAIGFSDELFGKGGNDTLEIVGGAGAGHTLIGGSGDDDYILGARSARGSHTIAAFESENPYYNNPGLDRLIISTDRISPDSVTLSKQGDDLVLDYGSGDVTVHNHFRDFATENQGSMALSRIEFRSFHTETDFSGVVSAVSWDKVVLSETEPAALVWDQRDIAEAVGLQWPSAEITNELLAGQSPEANAAWDMFQ